MGIPEVIEFSLAVLLIVFVLLCTVSLVAFALRKHRGRTWHQHYPNPARSILIRAGIASAAAVSAFVLVSAALTLNSHRPPGDNSPVIRVDGHRGPSVVELELDDCGETVTGRISVGPGPRRVRIYTDGEGIRNVPVDRHGEAFFDLEGVTAKRGLLSCYFQMPMVRGGEGRSAVSLTVGEEMEVDTFTSIPAPERYSGGEWAWTCPAGGACPVLATVSYAIEDGARQVIVLILAALFGSIIALLIGEALIEPGRRLADRIRPK